MEVKTNVKLTETERFIIAAAFDLLDDLRSEIPCTMDLYDYTETACAGIYQSMEELKKMGNNFSFFYNPNELILKNFIENLK